MFLKVLVRSGRPGGSEDRPMICNGRRDFVASNEYTAGWPGADRHVTILAEVLPSMARLTANALASMVEL